MNKKIKVSGSNGHLICDGETGKVIKINHFENCDEYEGIEEIDIKEYEEYWEEKIPDEIDILNVGYWVNGVYENPEYSWREELLHPKNKN